MLLATSLFLSLFSTVVIIIFHYWGLRTITRFSRRFTSHFFMSVSVVIFLFLIHIIEILWYALMLYFAFDIVGLNGFQGDTVLLPLDSFT